jgi:hypothetical protein
MPRYDTIKTEELNLPKDRDGKPRVFNRYSCIFCDFASKATVHDKTFVFAAIFSANSPFVLSIKPL